MQNIRCKKCKKMPGKKCKKIQKREEKMQTCKKEAKMQKDAKVTEKKNMAKLIGKDPHQNWDTEAWLVYTEMGRPWAENRVLDISRHPKGWFYPCLFINQMPPQSQDFTNCQQCQCQHCHQCQYCQQCQHCQCQCQLCLYRQQHFEIFWDIRFAKEL